MKIKYHKRFEKQFKKLSDKDKQKVVVAVDKFLVNPNHISLNNHQLKGRLTAMRAISAAPDLRLIFQESNGYVLVFFLDVGKHNRVYK
jgi:addiction module RelE/StbE family toxin